jgi:hypothetical protein
MAAVALTTTLGAEEFERFPNRLVTVNDFTELSPALLSH